MDFVKQHIALLVAGFVLWFTYGRLSEEDASAADRKKLEGIGQRYLAVRADDAPVPRLVDPYRFTDLEDELEEPSTGDAPEDDEGDMDASRSQDARPAGGRAPGTPVGSVAASAGGPRGTSTAAGSAGAPSTGPRGGSPAGAGATGRGGEGDGPAGPGVDVVVASVVEGLPPMTGPARFWVEAVLTVPGGGAARVCGRNVAVGEEIPGVDDGAPPVLVSVTGTHAVVRYRGDDLVVALDAPAVVVEPPPPEPAGAAARADSWFADWFPEGWE